MNNKMPKQNISNALSLVKKIKSQLNTQQPIMRISKNLNPFARIIECCNYALLLTNKFKNHNPAHRKSIIKKQLNKHEMAISLVNTRKTKRLIRGTVIQ